MFMLLNSAFQLMQSELVTKEEFWPEITKYEQLHTFAPFQLLKKELQETSQKTGMDMLWEIISKIHSNETFQNTMQAVLAGIITIGKLQRAVFFSLQDDKMLPMTGLNKDLELIDLGELSISTTILQETLKLGETRYFYDLQEDIPFDIHSSIFGLGLRTAVCYPLVVNNRMEGVIYADTTNDRRFNEAEQNLLQTVFAQAKVALEKTKKIESLRTQQQESQTNQVVFPEIIGNSKEMQQIYEIMKTVGEHNVNVLITGPTGSGKELIAKALHSEYDAKSAFVPLNCAAIPESLLESELFGYAKGAFTGADRNRKGKIEAADGGTLFLDEIAELPAVLQAKLLRVLQERIITPLGSNKEIPVSIRLICATNHDLEKMVEEGSFRQDLFYRINVVSIKLPGLKDRKDDILPLAEYFMQRYNEKFGKNIKSISNDSARLLLNHNWPGNVRQLENLVEKAVLMSSGDFLEVRNLLKTDNLKLFSADEPIPSNWQDYKKYRRRFVDQLDRRFAEKIILENEGNINRASRQANIPRPQIYRILNKKDTK
jgi:transcriptional regulator with GAF, ATPase, and Fis domain